MKKYKIIVLELAKTDIREARSWYNNQQKGLGLKLQADMRSALLKMARNPTSFAIRYVDLRLANFEFFLTPFTFILMKILTLFSKQQSFILADIQISLDDENKKWPL